MTKHVGSSPLDFRAKETRKAKRPYIFHFGEAKSCDHARMQIVAHGTNLYRCLECNYAFWIQSAIMWPLHWTPIMGAFMIGSFVKEFGLPALEQVFRTPIGQMDGSPHKPVLPPGKSFMEMLRALDKMATTSLEEGKKWPELKPWEDEAEEAGKETEATG